MKWCKVDSYSSSSRLFHLYSRGSRCTSTPYSYTYTCHSETPRANTCGSCWLSTTKTINKQPDTSANHKHTPLSDVILRRTTFTQPTLSCRIAAPIMRPDYCNHCNAAVATPATQTNRPLRADRQTDLYRQTDFDNINV